MVQCGYSSSMNSWIEVGNVFIKCKLIKFNVGLVFGSALRYWQMYPIGERYTNNLNIINVRYEEGAGLDRGTRKGTAVRDMHSTSLHTAALTNSPPLPLYNLPASNAGSMSLIFFGYWKTLPKKNSILIPNFRD